MDTHSLFDLTPVRARRTRRASSYDRSGANLDFRRLPAGASTTLLDVDGPGLITHIWFALGHMDYNYLRQLTIRVTWDDAPGPSVNCPLGDFLGVGHAVSNRYQSALTGMVRGTGRRGESTGGNTWFPMPFRRHARVEVTNESPIPCLACYFMVDWLEVEPAAVADAGYFHAAWRRENPKRVTPTGENDSYILLGRFGRNVSGADNFLVADLRGCGRFVGMNLSIDNLDDRVLGKNVNAYGEGDEMIFIDGEPRPSLHGTGTEDYFLDAWGMTGHANLYAGTSLDVAVNTPGRQRGTCYRYHVADPIYFRERLRFTFENGCNNCQANDMAATAYWFQAEPVACALAPVAGRLPRRDTLDPDPADEAAVVAALGATSDRWYRLFLYGTRAQVRAAGQGACGEALGTCFGLRGDFQEGKTPREQVLERLAPLDRALIAEGADEISPDTTRE